MKGNVINLNTLHLNSVRLNGIGKVQSVSLKGGSTEDPVFPPVEPPIEPEPTPTYTLSASVANGMVSAKRNGSAVNLPFTANEGDVIVVSVTPNDGYEFNGWADGNTDNPRSITMNADVALSAQCVEVVQPPVGKYIQFEDKAVEAICVANWSSDGIGLTEEDAAAVTDMTNTFKGNTDITSFNELEHFVNLQSLGTRTSNPSNYGTFAGCTNLKSVKIPPSVKTLGSFAFQYCVSLEDVGSLSGVEVMGETVFYNCAKLAITIYMPNLVSMATNAVFFGSGITGVDSLGTTGSVNFGGAWNKGVFQNCKAMKYMNIPSSVTTISGYDFQGCTSLEKLILSGATPPTLGSASALSQTNNCPIYVPDASLEAYKTATNWNQYADRIHPLSEIEGSPYSQFEDAEAERVLMANGVSSDGIGITKEDAENVVSIGTWFQNNTTIVSMNDLALLPNVTTLANKALQGCSSLTSIDLRYITKLGEKVFDGCTGLNGDFVAPSLESVATFYTFTGAQFKRYLDFGKLAVIPNGMFTNANSMVSVIIIPTVTTSIGNNQFYGDYSGKRTWIIKSATPCSVTANGWSGSKTFYVPDSSVDTYKAANGWSTFATSIKGISQLATDNPSLYSEIEKYL